MRFVHDGAPPHFSRVARQFLNQHFANKWIGHGGPIAWPAPFSGFESIRFSLVGTFEVDLGHVRESRKPERETWMFHHPRFRAICVRLLTPKTTGTRNNI